MSLVLSSFVLDPREPARLYHQWERDFERRQALRRMSFDAPSPPLTAQRSRVPRLRDAIHRPIHVGSEVAPKVKGGVVHGT